MLCGVGWVGAMHGERTRWKSAHLGEGGEEEGLEERETAGNPSLFFILGLKVLRNHVICS